MSICYYLHQMIRQLSHPTLLHALSEQAVNEIKLMPLEASCLVRVGWVKLGQHQQNIDLFPETVRIGLRGCYIVEFESIQGPQAQIRSALRLTYSIKMQRVIDSSMSAPRGGPAQKGLMISFQVPEEPQIEKNSSELRHYCIRQIKLLALQSASSFLGLVSALETRPIVQQVADLRMVLTPKQIILKASNHSIYLVVKTSGGQEYLALCYPKKNLRECQLWPNFHRFEVLSRNYQSGIAKLRAIFESANTVYFLVQEMGIFLEQYLQSPRHNLLNDMLILRKLTSTLLHLHKHGIVHCAIRSEGILISTQSEEVSPVFINLSSCKCFVGEQGDMAHSAASQIEAYKNQDVKDLGKLFYFILTRSLDPPELPTEWHQSLIPESHNPELNSAQKPVIPLIMAMIRSAQHSLQAFDNFLRQGFCNDSEIR